eukprot:486973_1
MLSFITFIYLASSSFAAIPPHSLNTNVACGYYTDCTIDCSNADNHIACAGNQIDGTDAKSLTVICDSSNYLGESDGYSGCKHTQITCPYNDEVSSCTILCTNPNDNANGSRPSGCENTFITTYINRKTDYLQVTCEGTEACKGLKVYAPSWQQSNTKIQCNAHSDEYGEGKDACSEMTVHSGYFDAVNNWLDSECEENQCDGLELRCGEFAIPVAKTMSKMAYNENAGEYECDDEKCCPLSSNTPMLGDVSGSEKDEERNQLSGEMIALIVVSVLLMMMCVVSGYLVFKLQREKQEKETVAGFVSLDA